MSVRRSPAPVRLAPVRTAPVRLTATPIGAASLVAVLRAGEAHLRRTERAPQPVGAMTDSWETIPDFLARAEKKLENENQEDVKLSTKIANLQAELARCNREQAVLLRSLQKNAMEKDELVKQNEWLTEQWQESVESRREAEGAPEPASPSKTSYDELDAEKKEALAEARERFTEDPPYVGPDMRGWGPLTDEERALAAKLAEEEEKMKQLRAARDAQMAARDAERNRMRGIIADTQRRGVRRDPSMGGVDFYDPGFGFGAWVENA